MHSEKRVEYQQKGFPDRTGECHHPMQTPVKYEDLGCLTISVDIGGICVEKALLDLRAIVKLLPY